MPGCPISTTLLVALRNLDKTDGRQLLKGGVKELIALRVLEVVTLEEPRRLRSPQRRFLLVDGPEPMPSERLLAAIARMVGSAPSELSEGRVVRDLGVVAEHLASQRDVRDRTRDAALAELAHAGLVATEERRALGIIKRTVHLRTPAGEAALERDASRRRRRASREATGDSYASFGAYGSGDADDSHDPEERSDTDLDAALDSSFDAPFEPSFDSSFDSSFDTAFDSGFSSGDSGGSSGDGGGGGGGGGGDGGGGGS